MDNANLRIASRALNLAADVTTTRQSLVLLGMTAVSLLAMPESVSGWTLVWIVVSALLATITLVNIYKADQIESPAESLPHIGIGFGAGLLAVIISMIVRPISGMFLAVVLILLSIAFRRRPFVTVTLSVIAIPWWVWLTASSWRWELLILVPIVGLGLIAASHILDTHTWPEGQERILPERAHRAAAWMMIALTGILIMVAGLIMDVSRPWLALAGIVLAAAIPLEAGFGTTSEGSAKPGLRIVSSAFLVAVACWLIGIT